MSSTPTLSKPERENNTAAASNTSCRVSPAPEARPLPEGAGPGRFVRFRISTVSAGGAGARGGRLALRAAIDSGEKGMAAS